MCFVFFVSRESGICPLCPPVEDPPAWWCLCMELWARRVWDPFNISRSIATIPRVIIGRAYIGCFGGIWVRVLGLDDLFGASSPTETTSLSAIHACLCSAVMRVVISHTPGKSRIGRGDVGSMRLYFAGTVHCHASEVFWPLHDIPPSDSCNFFLRCPCHHACG